MRAINAAYTVILHALLLVHIPLAFASNLPSLDSDGDISPHKFFIYSDTQTNSQQFEVWTIDSGYSYAIYDSLDIYFGARLDSAENSVNNGFLSGVRYQLSDRISVKSSLRGYQYYEGDSKANRDGIAAEVSSRVQISENLDLHATFDFHRIQQGVEVGLGFRF